jgi:hypothetical protein
VTASTIPPTASELGRREGKREAANPKKEYALLKSRSSETQFNATTNKPAPESVPLLDLRRQYDKEPRRYAGRL